MEIKKRSKFVWSFCFLYLTSYIYAAKVSILGRKLLVDGKEFIIKGVCYSPTPVGEASGYNWSKIPEIYNTDFPMIKSMGANTIRTFAIPTEKSALDALYNNGLYIIMGYWVNPGQDFSNSTVRTTEKNNFLNMVN
ncbi:MAG: hypothetical protein ACK4JE_04500, partial [Endomicrobiia bacterium]